MGVLALKLPCGPIVNCFSEGDQHHAEELFWLSEEQWARIEPHLPINVRGVERG